jgi:ADP-ribose pyrophosphatase YjhB (NUDIX family)
VEDDILAAARRAAVREAQEEAGLIVAPDDLIFVSHWTTPEGRPERFSTWFFASAAGDGAVRIDGGEIHDHRWLRPDYALAAQRLGEIELPPPTFVTLTKLSQYRTTVAVLSTLAQSRPEIFTPRNYKVPDGVCSFYTEDAGYADGNVNRLGQRHRLWMLDNGWRYERSESV